MRGRFSLFRGCLVLFMVNSVHAGVTCCNAARNLRILSGSVALGARVTPLTRFAKVAAFYPVLLV